MSKTTVKSPSSCYVRIVVFVFGLMPAYSYAGYHITKQILVGGNTGWDYLEPDPASRRLFVTHENHVVVLNMDTLKVVGDIPDCPGMGGVALSREMNRGFTACGDEDAVGVFQLDTLKRIAKWKTTGRNPNQIAYEPTTRRVFSFNSTGRNVTAFDAKTGKVLSTSMRMAVRSSSRLTDAE